MNRIIILVLVCVTVFFTAETQSPQREETVILLGEVSYTPYQDEYEKMLYPTVRITAGFGTGSGVIIDSSSFLDVSSSKETNHKQLTTNYYYVLTACHVVDKANTVNIELYNSTIITGTVVITDTAKDLALLKLSNISAKGGSASGTGLQKEDCIRQHLISNIYYARLAPRDYTPYLFTPVWAVGCSLGLKPRPSYGHITAINEQLAISNAQFSLLTAQCPFWEISAPVLPGNSGGPVYDARTFEVIGIAVWVKVYDYQLITTMAGIVPIGEIYKFLDSHQGTKTPRK